MNDARVRCIWIALVAALLTGCSQGAIAPEPVGPAQRAAAPRVASQYLYAANLFGNSVTVYDLQTGALVRTVTKGVKAPTVVAIGPDKNIYVADSPCCKPHGGGFVSVYTSGATKLLRTIKGLSAPNALTFDSKGQLYVADAQGSSTSDGEIDVYARGGTVPVRRIDRGLAQPVAEAIDTSGTLYVDNAGFDQGTPTVDGNVAVYPAGASSPSVTLQPGVPGPATIALDSQGQLYVAAGSSISVYSAGGASLIHSIAVGSGAFVDFLAFDGAGDLYATTQTSIAVYSPTWTLLRSLPADTEGPSGLAFDASGNLYASNVPPNKNGYISEYASGSSQLVRTIHRGINHAFSIAIGSMK